MKIEAISKTINPQKWVANYSHLLKNFARLRISDDFVVEELIQETFLAALKSKDNYKGKAKESTWLIAILRNKIIDHYRNTNSYKGIKRKTSIREDDYFTVYRKEITNDTLDENDIYNEIYAKELNTIIDKSFDLLTSREQTALKLKLEGRSTKNICDALDTNEANYWVILHRGRQKIKKHIHKNWSHAV